MIKKFIKPDSYWRKVLSPVQYRILREKDTEPAFSGNFIKNKEDGIYSCIACKNKLFSSKSKFESGTGWPSFFEPISKNAVIIQSIGEKIDGAEVLCAKCKGHLGHIFLDGPTPTGKRFCMNSAVLDFNTIRLQ